MINISIGFDGKTAKVTDRQQLVTAPLEYSKAYITTLDVDDTAYNVVPPLANKKFVITSVILTGNKGISTTVDAIVELYEASTPTSTTVDNTLGLFRVPRSSALPLFGLNLITETESKYINAKTSDDDVDVTLYGYYVEA